MQAIDRVGTFRGTPQEWGVGETKNGYPQFVLRVLATEMYDEELAAWVPWAEYGAEIIGYLVLYTKDSKSGQWKELLNAQQLKKALDWDGVSFGTLANGRFGNKPIMFRVEENDYNGNVSLKLTWVDVFDADPVRQLQKYTPDKIAEMDVRFAGIMKTTAPAPTPAKAPARPTLASSTLTPPGVPGGATVAGPKSPTRRGRPPKNSPPVGVETPPPADIGPAPVAAGTAPLEPPIPAPTVPTTPAPSGPPSSCTKEEAWAAVCSNELRTEEATDAKIAEIWVEAVTALNKPEDKITPAEWGTIREAIIGKTSKF